MEQKKRTYGQKASPAVEAPAEDTVKVRSLRLSDDTVEELNAAKKALDVRTMDEAMQAILDTFSMSMAKDAIPERATEIGEFEVATLIKDQILRFEVAMNNPEGV